MIYFRAVGRDFAGIAYAILSCHICEQRKVALATAALVWCRSIDKQRGP